MQWKILPQKSDDLIEQLLINRGIESALEKNNFFNPNLENHQKDLEIKNIPVAQKRIKEAIKKGELIFVSGDYDVDGICGAAVLYLGLTALGAKALPYIPHREKEGYGISKIGLELAKEKGAKLVLSVDCGIVDFEQAKYAKSLGLDLIITDHHQALKVRPEALTIIHSTKICGTAVAWCLIHSFSKQIAGDLLDLVSIATVADMMPMIGINRAFVRRGLEKINATKKVGLKALIDEAGLTLGGIGSYEIGHVIAPRLNAAGRLESAMGALRLICTKDVKKAGELARLLGETNETRKKLTMDALYGARLKLVQTKKIHILSDKDWNPGIIGLVAGRICEETKRPAIAISIGSEHSKGSARSINGVNIIEMMRQCQDILVAVGGHPGAAGFTVQTSKIAELTTRLELLIEKSEVQEISVDIESVVQSNNINMELCKNLLKFEPFGVGNIKPVLAIFKGRVSHLKTVGQGTHLKGKVDEIDFIAFNKGDLLGVLPAIVDVAFTLDTNKFNGVEKLQLMVKDFRV